MRHRDTRTRRRRRALLAGAALSLAAALLLSGCSGSGDAADPPTYKIPAETAREGEMSRGKTGRSADMRFTVIGFRTDMTDVMGTHAAMDAKGAFTRIRLLAANTGRDIQVFDTWKQRLITADGRAHSPT